MRTIVLALPLLFLTGCIATYDMDPPQMIQPAVVEVTIPPPVPQTAEAVPNVDQPIPSPAAIEVPTPSEPPKTVGLCKTVFQVVFASAEMVADSLGCIDVQAVAADLSAPLAKVNLCKPGPSARARGVVGSAICPVLVGYVVDYATRRLPESWQCSGGFATIFARKQISDACVLAFPY